MDWIWKIFSRKNDPRCQEYKTCPKCGDRVKKLVDHSCLDKVMATKHRLDAKRRIVGNGNVTRVQCEYCGLTYDPELGACPHCTKLGE